MTKARPIKGFSRLSKEDKIEEIVSLLQDPEAGISLLKSFWHDDANMQKLFEEFSENTVSNYFFPYGVAPNFMINGQVMMMPMVIEESSVVAAAANSARFWIERGGFHSKVISTTKIGQVHFIWEGEDDIIQQHFAELRTLMLQKTSSITANMEKRGGGILDIELLNKRNDIPGYYQVVASFDTRDAMGANFINSCLEEFADVLRENLDLNPKYGGHECQVIMSILSNYTPECLVEAWVECPVASLKGVDDSTEPEEFVNKFIKAVEIAQVDIHRAATHNKGIFNGIDAVALATGNDFRAIEACGHAYAARSGSYKGLTEVEVKNNIFRYTLRIPMALGSVGGLTSLHPMARFSLEMMGNPSAEKLMMIASAAGLANNFSALKSLVTKGIQKGHMKMHLLNILNSFNATDQEKELAIEYFKTHKVSTRKVSDFLDQIR
ncbi:MAG TPA: hydroxymethylglutaryl-CoA reductase, degradative [Bacteroidales bacterium]|nr:hydroxymethylglutaryl-CoA reductase, degradative [Bacteroidales bacterium]